MLIWEAPRNDRACPYCGTIFPKAPRAKTRCKSCGGYVYVRTKQQIFNSDLLTEEDMLAADFFKMLTDSGATTEAYFRAAADMTEKFGQAANFYDAVWTLSNRMIAERACTSTSPGDVLSSSKMITLSQAWYQYRRNRNPAPYLRIVRNYELKELSNILRLFPAGIYITVLSKDCCEACRSRLGDKYYELETLLAEPLLPVADCTKNLEARKFSYCTCMYTFVEKT